MATTRNGDDGGSEGTRAEKTARTTRKKTTRKAAKKTAGNAPAKKTSGTRTSAAKQIEALEGRLGELLGGVSSRLADIEARLPPPAGEGGATPPAPARAGAAEGAAALGEVAGRLSQALDEVPRAADFEPLAEHIYELARHAPRLLEALEAVPGAMAPFEQSVASLRETAETLQYVHESFAESLLRLPRAEDYEPLAKPLAEFARVSPALAESLADVLRVTSPLGESVAGLRRISDELSATRDALAATGTRQATPEARREDLEAVAAELRDARAAVDAALGSLPRDPEYKKVADQLREIASVSPSLLEWMQQVTPLSQPLGESVSALRETAERLELAYARLLDAIGPREG